MKKSIITMMMILLSTSVVAGTTFAWFSASADPIVNEFTAGTVEISVEETQTPEVFMMENWNPGDCGMKEYTIINIGTKGIYLRGKFTGAWYENDGVTPFTPDPDEGVVSWGFCQDQGDQNWTVYEGYYYYNDPIGGTYTVQDETQRTVTLCISVCLDGPSAGNQYQGKVFKLTAEFEAVQSSNGAVDDVWPDNPYTVVVPTPTPTLTPEPTVTPVPTQEPTPEPTSEPTPTPSLGSGTAWADGTYFNGGNATYFEYAKGSGSLFDPEKVDLIMGADRQDVGDVYVWNTNSKIFYKIVTVPGQTMQLIHSYIGLEQPLEGSPGRLGFTYDPSQDITEYVYMGSYVYTDWASSPNNRGITDFDDVQYSTPLYIAIHTEISD